MYFYATPVDAYESFWEDNGKIKRQGKCLHSKLCKRVFPLYPQVYQATGH